MPDPTQDLQEIARKLSKAQRAYLTTHAKWRRVGMYSTDPRWMTFPPSNTHAVLMRLALVSPSGIITDLGFAIRDLLNQEQPHD